MRAKGRERGIRGVASILRALQIKPMTTVQVHREVGAGRSDDVRVVLCAMADSGLIHVARRVNDGRGKMIAQWKAGKGRGKHPAPMDRIKRSRISVTTMAYFMRGLEAGPMSRAQISEHIGMSSPNIDRLIKHCRDIDLIHIDHYVRGAHGGKPTAFFALGHKLDAEYPHPIPSLIRERERLRRRRELPTVAFDPSVPIVQRVVPATSADAPAGARRMSSIFALAEAT